MALAVGSKRFAGNNHGIEINPLDFNAAKSTTTKTYHGISIVVNGNIIGRIQNWNPQMYNREGSHVYELSNLTFGRPVDYVPGVNRQYTISCSRAEVWNEELEIALGYEGIWSDLIDQTKPFEVVEYLIRGNDIYKAITYSGCWFTSKNYNDFSAEDIPKIIVSAEISFVGRQVTVGV